MIALRFAALALAGLLLAPGCGEAGAPEAADPAPAPPPAAAGAGLTGPPLDLRTLGYTAGSPDAPVLVVEFSDFGCGYCRRFASQTYPELHREFVESGQVAWRYVPFVLGIFPNGDLAAVAGECAGEQDRFWPMHDLLFERQGEWKGSDDADGTFAALAGEAGLDEEAFRSCYGQRAPEARIARANDAAAKMGVRATPTFFVNGQRVEGALPVDQFRMLLQWAGAGDAR